MGRKCIGKRVMTAKERAARSRSLHRSEGGAVLTVRLSGDAAKRLERLQRYEALTKTQVIEKLIDETFMRLRSHLKGKKADPRRRRRLEPNRMLPEGVPSLRLRRRSTD